MDIDVQKLPLDQPLDPILRPAEREVQCSGRQSSIDVGPVSDVNLSISAGTTATLTPFFKAQQVLIDHGMTTFFDQNPHRIYLVSISARRPVLQPQRRSNIPLCQSRAVSRPGSQANTRSAALMIRRKTWATFSKTWSPTLSRLPVFPLRSRPAKWSWSMADI